MPPDWSDKLLSIWPDVLVGTAVIVAGMAVGWYTGDYKGSWPVLAVRWWLNHVVAPLIANPSWLRRAATIAVNNNIVCGIVVGLGAAGHFAWLGVVGVGLGLGIALRLMLAVSEDLPTGPQLSGAGKRCRTVVGLTLNLLEVPAIALAAGLGLAQGSWSATLGTREAMVVFGIVVVPLLLISAAGEAMWMGVDKAT